MKTDTADNQPIIMCPGESARYLCDAGGINALKVLLLQKFENTLKNVNTI